MTKEEEQAVLIFERKIKFSRKIKRRIIRGRKWRNDKIRR